MPLKRPLYAAGGFLVLGGVWLWPVPDLAIPPFTKHMASHMAVVAVAAPLLALGLAGGPADPVKHLPRALSAIAASMLELCVVWAWHVPRLHHAARHDLTAHWLEQSTFLVAGFLLWMAALGGSRAQRRGRFVANTAGVLLTSMHMTLLGVLIATTPRALYHAAETAEGHGQGLWAPLTDQQLGGAVMLLFGAVAYLLGGLWLCAEVLRAEPQKAR